MLDITTISCHINFYLKFTLSFIDLMQFYRIENTILWKVFTFQSESFATGYLENEAKDMNFSQLFPANVWFAFPQKNILSIMIIIASNLMKCWIKFKVEYNLKFHIFIFLQTEQEKKKREKKERRFSYSKNQFPIKFSFKRI